MTWGWRIYIHHEYYASINSCFKCFNEKCIVHIMQCLHYPYFYSDEILVGIYSFTLSMGEKIYTWFLLLNGEGS